MTHVYPIAPRGVALDVTEEEGAHSPIPEISTKSFTLNNNNAYRQYVIVIACINFFL